MCRCHNAVEGRIPILKRGAFTDIAFDFVSGFRAEYSKWMEGYRIKVNGNDVKYYKAADPSTPMKILENTWIW